MEVEEDEDIDDEIETAQLKEIVVPGEVLSEDLENFNPGRGTVKLKNKIISVYVGLKIMSRPRDLLLIR